MAGSKTVRIIFVRTAACLAVVLSCVCISCHGSGKQYAAAITNRDSSSFVTTYGADMLISENGTVRYHVIAEEWMMFDKMDPPFWSLNKGVYLEIYDSLMQVESILRADTAVYFNHRGLWQLRNNVHAENIDNEQFDTPELFINNSAHRIYSDSIIKISQTDRVLTGVGFESNTNMTEYFIRHTQGVFPVSENDSVNGKNDSLVIESEPENVAMDSLDLKNARE